MGREPLTPFTSVETVHRICCTYALDACVSASLEQLSGKLSDCKKIIANGHLLHPSAARAGRRRERRMHLRSPLVLCKDVKR